MHVLVCVIKYVNCNCLNLHRKSKKTENCKELLKKNRRASLIMNVTFLQIILPRTDEH